MSLLLQENHTDEIGQENVFETKPLPVIRRRIPVKKCVRPGGTTEIFYSAVPQTFLDDRIDLVLQTSK